MTRPIKRHATKGLKSTKTILKQVQRSSFEYRKYKRYWLIQRDLRLGKSWSYCMVEYKCSRPTIQKAAKAVIPDDYRKMLEDPGGKASDVSLIKKDASRKCLNLSLNNVEFAEDPEQLNFKLFPMQKLILKAFYGIPIDNTAPVPAFAGMTEQGMLDSLVAKGKCTWKGPGEYRELVLVVGMKGGKSALAGVIAAIEEYSLYKHEDFRAHFGLPKGKQVVILNVAANEEQAKKTIFAEVDALIRNAPYYQRRQAPGSNATSHFFEDQNVIIQSGHSNGNALVGPLTKAVLLDELDRFSSKADGKSSGMHMYNSISRSVAPFKMDGKIISISSPMNVNGPIIKLFNMSKAEPTMLGFWLATWELNPNLPLESPIMQADLRKCPEDFWRDFGAQPAHSLEKYYRDRKKVDDIFTRGEALGLRDPVNANGTFADWFKGDPNYTYHLHMDPSVKNDHFGISMCHRTDAHVVVDLIHCFKADKGEIDYSMVEEFLDVLCDRFPTLNTATYDVYLAVQLYQRLQRKGITTEFLLIDKDAHDKLKIECVYTGRLVCYNSPIFRRELRDLDLVSGKKVDHPVENEEGGRGSKDEADSVAGAVIPCLAEGEFTEAISVCGDEPRQQQREEGGIFGNSQQSIFGGDIGGGGGIFGGERGGRLIW